MPKSDGLCGCGCGEAAPIAPRSYAKRGIFKGEPMRFIAGHGARGTGRPLIERIEARRLTTPSGCWEWTGSRQANGYGRVGLNIDGRWVPRMVHRIYYEIAIGPIPADMDLDHLCRNRACFNPEHLEPVTRKENARRGINGALTTHCPQGHPYDDANTHITKQGHRSCRACNRERARLRTQQRQILLQRGEVDAPQ